MRLANLESICNAKGISAADLSRLTGLSDAQISRLRSGQRNARPHTALLLAMLLECRVADLTGEALIPEEVV